MVNNYEIPASVSIPYDGIDAEHANLVGLLNVMLRAVQTGQTLEGEALKTHLTALSEATLGHFDHEEQEMAGLGFDGLAQHKAHHVRCVSRLDTVSHAIRSNNALIQDELEEIFDIIVEDAIRADLGFKSFLYKKGILV